MMRTRTPDGPNCADPVTSDRLYAEDEAEFLRAVDAYRRRTGRAFPTCCEMLAILKGLGYAKVPA